MHLTHASEVGVDLIFSKLKSRAMDVCPSRIAASLMRLAPQHCAAMARGVDARGAIRSLNVHI